MKMEKKIVLFSILAVLIIITIILSALIIVEENKIKTLSGLAVLSTLEEENKEASTFSQPNVICLDTQCNPQNSQQICNNGQWVNCPSDQVCSLDACTIPSKIKTIVSGGSGGGSSSSSGSTTTSDSAPAQLEIIQQIGEITGSMLEDINLGEKLIFTIKGIEHTIKLLELTQTNVKISFKDGETAIFSLAEEKSIDDDNNGQNDFLLKLKSTNTIEKKTRFMITEL